MGAEAKEVKVSFAVDSASADKLRRTLAQITDDVNKLVDATSKINFGGAKVGNFSSGKGNGSATTQLNQKVVSGPASTVVDGLTRAVTASSSLFKVASSGAIGSFKIMGDALRDMVSKSDREISRLEGSMAKLEKTYSKLKARQGSGRGGKLTDAAIEENQRQYFDEMSQLSSAHESRNAFNKNLRALNPTAWDRIKSFWGVPQGGFTPGTNPLDMIGKVAGSPGGAIVAGVSLGYKASQYLAGAGNTFSAGNVQYALDRPMLDLQNRGALGGVYGGMALRARGGAISQTMAYDRLLHNRSLEDIIGKEAAERTLAGIQLNNPRGIIDSITKGKGFGIALSQRIGQAYSGAQSFFKGAGVDDRAGSLTGQEISYEKLIRAMPADAAARFNQAMQAEEQSNPLMNQIANDVYSNAFGDIGGINASRTSGRVIYDKKTGKPINLDYDLLRSKIQKNLFDPDQVFGMMGQLSGILGRRLSGPGIAQKILSMNIGGFDSAAGVFSAGSQFGGGLAGGNRLTGAFQSLIGGRGLDIGAGSMIGGLASSQMLSGHFLGSGEGLASVLGGAAYAGNTGEEMFNARAMGGGLSAMDSFASGGLDRLQGGINMSAALQAAPNASWQTKRLLLDLNSASLLDIVKTGKLPAALERTGITIPMINQYLQSRNRLAFARTNDMMLSPAAREARNQYVSQGIGFLRSYQGKARKDKLVDLANAMRTGTRHSFEEDYEMFRIEASAAGILKGPRGTGAGRSISRQALAAHGAMAQGENTRLSGKDKADNERAIANAVDKTPGTAAGFEESRKSTLDSIATQIDKEAMSAKQALTTMVDLISQMAHMGSGAEVARKGVPIYDPKAGKVKKPSSAAGNGFDYDRSKYSAGVAIQ